ncbi:hypothetical protein [Rhizobium mesosinicum]|uniref:Uncharacterized protein n=1 Tax=Rhizobium mesosinicum TaxID=335017 RepID=A0ABS7H1D7_9HYPH|nr:hypothetical protein [Rhizobium mesosinicum]MBW9055971.1 hypothetical protein [Rhizobium mesosinicum]
MKGNPAGRWTATPSCQKYTAIEIAVGIMRNRVKNPKLFLALHTKQLPLAFRPCFICPAFGTDETESSRNKEMVFNGTQLEQISLAEIAFGKS